MKKHLYVPIEIKCREYPAKGELALKADRKGFVSVKGLCNPFGAAPSLQGPRKEEYDEYFAQKSDSLAASELQSLMSMLETIEGKNCTDIRVDEVFLGKLYRLFK